MSTTIDERVVEMRFDNDQFESNVNESISTLAKLKQSLNLTGASKGLEAVNNAAKRVSFAPISNAMDQVATRFSHAQMTIQHQIDRWADKIVGAAERAIKALTIDPVKSGFQEYETQINSVQTILANTQSKGTTLNDVNSALDTLNKYADKTIYNFTEMTRNIGTFTAAGVDLDTSVNAIQGIANLAAVSGSTSQQASTAMYQLSQALASGTVKLMDWNSVVNAGMGGQVFQDALKETARVHGIAIDDMIKKNGSFRETLKDGWLTSEILTETLQKFTLTTEGLTKEQIEANKQMLKSKGYTEEQIEEIFKLGEMATNAATKVKTFTQLFDTLKEAAQSGWTQTWETIVGDFEESKELMTNISEVVGGFINASSEARNNLLSEALDSNWEKLVDEINKAGIETNVFEEKARAAMEAHGLDVDKLIEEHGSLANVFKSGAVSSDILKEAVDKLRGGLVDLSKIQRELKKGHTGDDVKAAQEALKNMGYDLGKAGIDGKFGNMTEKAVKAFQELNGLEVTGIIDDKTLAALEKASEASAKLSKNCDDLISKITELGGREKIIESLKNVFKYLGDVIKPVKEAFREIFPKTQASQIVSVIDSFHNFTKSLKVTSEQAEKIKSVFKGLFSVIDIGFEAFKQLARGLFGIIGNFKGIGGSILDASSSIGDWLSGIRDTIIETDIFGTAVDKVVGFVSSVIDKLKDFKSSADEAFEGSKLKGFLGFFKGLWDFVTTIGSKIGDIGANILGTVAETAGDPNTWNVLTSGLFAGIFAGIARFVNKLPGLIGGIDEVVENVTGVLDDVRGCFQAYQTQLKAGTLLKIASAIAILAASIFVISTINPDALDQSLGAITILFGELLGSLALFSKMSGDLKGVFKTNSAIIALSTSVVILALALKILSTMSWDQIANGLLATVIGLGALVGAVNLLPKKNVSKSAKAIRTLTISLVIFAAALKIMSTMSWDQIANGLLATIIGLGILVAAVRLLPKDTGLRTLGMVGLTFALIVLAGALKLMSTMSWSEIGRGLTATVVGLGALVFAVKLLPKSTAIRVLGIIGLASSLIILASALKIMGTMSWDQIANGLLATVIGLAAFVAAIRLLPKTTAVKVAGLVGLATSIVILAAALKIMATMNWDQLANGLLATIVSLGAFVIAIRLLPKDTALKAAGLVILASSLIVLAAALKIMGSMSWEQLGKGLVTVVVALGVLAAAGLLMGPLIPTILGVSGAFALFGIALLAIGAGLVLASAGFTALAAAGATGATAIVAALTIIIMGIANLIPQLVSKFGDVILALCEVIISCAPTIVDTVLKLILEVLKALETYAPQILDSLLGLIIGLLRSLAEHLPELIQVAVEVIAAFFQGVVDALSGLDVETIFKGIIGVGILAGLMFALSAVVSLIPGAMAGVLGMGAVIAELAIVLAAIGALSLIPGLNWLMEKGGNLLGSIGNAIGQLIGGIVGGIAEGITSALPGIGEDLSNFMINLQPFIDGAKQLEPSLLDSMTNLAKVILTLTAAELLDAITSWITGEGSLTKFAEQLVPFGEAMVAFSSTVAGKIDEGAVTAAATAGMVMSELQKSLPRSGGWLQEVIGEKDLAAFGASCVAFGKEMIKFSNAIVEGGGINVNAIQAASDAGALMNSLQKSLPRTGGWLQEIIGEQDLATFGASCVAFGKEMIKFSNAIVEGGGVDVSVIQDVVDAGSIMTSLQSTLPKQGGWWQSVAGEQDLAKFGASCVAFGQALTNFSTNTAIDENAVSKAANAGSMMAELQSNIPEDGWFDGKVDLEDFGKKIVKYGEKLVDYSDTVEDMDNKSVEKSLDATLKLVEIARALEYLEGDEEIYKVSGMLDLADALVSYGEKMENVYFVGIGNSLEQFTKIKNLINNLVGLDISGVNSFKNGIERLGSIDFGGLVTSFEGSASKLAEVGMNIVEFISRGMQENEGDLRDAASRVVKVASDEVKSRKDSFGKAGKDLMNIFVNHIKSSKSKASGAMKETVTACLASVRNQAPAFTTAGSNLVDGFANGISANSYKAVAKAKAMAEAAEQAAKEALGIASPSKVFYKIGDFTGQGFINALAGYASKAYKSATNMGDSAKSGLNDALSKAYDIIQGDLETQPTIRPVLDLSSVEAGASRMNGLLNGVSNVGVTTNMNAIGSMMDRRRQNGSNADVVSAIDKLRKGLDNNGGTTYNINGVSYDDGSNIADAVETIARAALRERRT